MSCSGAIKKVNRTLRILEEGTEKKQNNNPLSLHDHIVLFRFFPHPGKQK